MKTKLLGLAPLCAMTLWGVSAAFLAPAGASAAQKKEDIILAELRQIQAQLAQLQTSQAALKSAVEDLEERVVGRETDERKTIADSRLAMERIQQELSVLSERVDETNQRLGAVSREVSSLRVGQQPLVLPPAAGEGETAGGSEGGESATAEATPVEVAPVATAAPSVTDIYNQARIDYTQGRYPLAISGFREVLELDRAGDLADNAHYWMGESYINQNQFEQAIQSFDTIIRDYPDSNKLPDAYLKKAMTLEQMEKRSEALLNYELVIDQFPRSPQARVARRRLEELMRTTVPRRP